jgi:hypothetical protein
MKSQKTRVIWQAFPGSHLHCDVTSAGINAYQIVMSVWDDDQEIKEIFHYGSGDLEKLKDEALDRLIAALGIPISES